MALSLAFGNSECQLKGMEVDMNSDSMLILLIIVSVVLFAGEPDLMDAIIHFLMKG